MMRQTFQRGDRVRNKVYINARANTIEYGTIEYVENQGARVRFDKKDVNRPDDGIWFMYLEAIEHDRDFQAGDWVRYEGVDEHAQTKEFEQRIGQITKLSADYYPGAVVSGLQRPVLISNLVKIAPPTEGKVVFRDCYVHTDEPPKTVTIEHDQWGRVVFVKPGYFGHSPGIKGWERDGCVRFEIDGWREVKPKRWVPVDIEIQNEGKKLVAWVNGAPDTYPLHFHLGKGYRWKTVEIEREEEG